jgi:signal transduction histidine kinase
MIAVILLNDRFPGDVPVTVAALTGIVVCVLALGRRVARLPEGDQAVEPELGTDTAATKRHVELIRTAARENLAEARVMVAELTPTALHEGSLPSAIQRQCERLSDESGIAVTMRADGDLPPVGMATDVVLLRATQGAFANIRRHSQATTVAVELSSTHRVVRLSLVDNGIGLTEMNNDGFGLRGMGARVAQVGGTMSVSPTAGGGTTVNVDVPV